MVSETTQRLLDHLAEAPPTVPMRLSFRPDTVCAGCGCKLVAVPYDHYPQIEPDGPRYHPPCITTARNLAALRTDEIRIE